MVSAVFKTVARRLAPWVGSIPIHSRHAPLRIRRDRAAHARIVRSTTSVGRAAACAVAGCALLAADGVSLQAQRADSARAGAASRDIRPPLSPRRAFVTSLVVPGYAQSRLGRPNAAALFILTEAIAILMVRETSIELREARRLQDDGAVARFVDPQTGQPDTTFVGARYPTELVRARRAHLEDWIAALVANHIIAGADAFVAAHLWDVPVRVGLRRSPNGVAVAARHRW